MQTLRGFLSCDVLQVQEAIVHSQEVFLRQVQLKERALVTRVLHAWRDIKYFASLT